MKVHSFKGDKKKVVQDFSLLYKKKYKFNNYFARSASCFGLWNVSMPCVLRPDSNLPESQSGQMNSELDEMENALSSL